MSPAELKKRFPHASPDFIRRNAAALGLRFLETAEPERGAVAPLVETQRAPSAGQDGLPPMHERPRKRLRVALVAHLRRRMDDDNLAAGLKPLRDAIAHELGLDDADDRIVFEYGQHETRGPEGTRVEITEEERD